MFDYRIKAGKPTHLGVTKNGKDIQFAVVVPDQKSCSLILYKKGSNEISARLDFTEDMQFGDIYAMQIVQFPVEEYEYQYEVDNKIVLDPYARRVVGQEEWGVLVSSSCLRGAVSFERFSWQGDKPLALPYEDCVLYVTHPRGFTKDSSSRVKHPGTFLGIKEKISYLKKLGITQLELMPVYEFSELGNERKLKKHMPICKNSVEKLNYWGYGPAYFFAPKASYSAYGNPVREFKELVRELHKNGIELILEFYFPPLTNPNLIQDCIRYWVLEYHIDGVHINSSATPLASLASDYQLSRTKIMSEYFPIEQIYAASYEPGFRKLAQYHDDFLIKARRFLKGDEDMLEKIAESIRKNPSQQGVVNYIANHNGFTLRDAVSYDVKHNEANGEQNRDGSNYNFSSNYGAEGPSNKKALEQLRRRQMRNAFLLILLSQGVPAIYGGDEMGNSQMGNNNVYCQDNELSWIQWSRKKEDKQLQQFVRDAIAFRREHAAFGRREAYLMKDTFSKGMPDLSYHGEKAWYGNFESYHRHMGILYAGDYTQDETLYVIYNMHLVEHKMALPTLPSGEKWYLAADTGRESAVFSPKGERTLLENQKIVTVPPRTIWILAGEKDEVN